MRRGAARGGHPSILESAAPPPASVAPRPRRRRHGGPRAATDRHFAERLEATASLVGLTQTDEWLMERTRALEQWSTDEIIDAVQRRLLADPETAAYLADPGTAVTDDAGGVAVEAFRAWLRVALEGPLDAEMAAHLASVGAAHVHTRNAADARIMARYLLIIMNRALARIIETVGYSAEDPADVARMAMAWSKRIAIELDLLFAVYGATAATAHWY